MRRSRVLMPSAYSIYLFISVGLSFLREVYKNNIEGLVDDFVYKKNEQQFYIRKTDFCFEKCSEQGVNANNILQLLNKGKKTESEENNPKTLS